MKFALSAALLLALAGVAVAESGAPANMSRWKLAQSADACAANCASQAASCGRACPATFSTPCRINCDNQAKSCQQSCQRK